MNSRTEPALCSWPASKTDQSKRAKNSYPDRNIIFFLLERLNVYICTVLNLILTYKEIFLNVHKICVICREGKQRFFQIRFSLFSETFDYVLYVKNILCRFDGKSCKVKTHIDFVRLHSCLQDSPFCYRPRASKLLGHFFRPIQVPLFLL